MKFFTKALTGWYETWKRSKEMNSITASIYNAVKKKALLLFRLHCTTKFWYLIK